jgi:hypothetical protein
MDQSQVIDDRPSPLLRLVYVAYLTVGIASTAVLAANILLDTRQVHRYLFVDLFAKLHQILVLTILVGVPLSLSARRYLDWCLVLVLVTVLLLIGALCTMPKARE